MKKDEEKKESLYCLICGSKNLHKTKCPCFVEINGKERQSWIWAIICNDCDEPQVQ